MYPDVTSNGTLTGESTSHVDCFTWSFNELPLSILYSIDYRTMNESGQLVEELVKEKRLSINYGVSS